MRKTRGSPRRSAALATLWGAPIGLLGGLIGLSGAEFRLPVLVGVFGYAARRAVVLNLAISLITVASSLLIRGGTLSLAPLLALLPVAGAMICGAVSAAYLGRRSFTGSPSMRLRESSLSSLSSLSSSSSSALRSSWRRSYHKTFSGC